MIHDVSQGWWARKGSRVWTPLLYLMFHVSLFPTPAHNLGTQRVLWLFSGMRCVHLFIFVDLPYRDPFHDPRTCTVDIAGRGKNGTTAAAQPALFRSRSTIYESIQLPSASHSQQQRQLILWLAAIHYQSEQQRNGRPSGGGGFLAPFNSTR